MAAAAPIVVSVPLAPATPDTPVILLAADPLVAGTAFLRWQPAPAGAAGEARVQLSTFQMVRAFASRCSVSRVPGDLAAARTISILTLRFAETFWSRILTELVGSGLLARPLGTSRELLERISSLAIANPGELLVIAADLSAAEAFAIPGRAAAAAQAALATPVACSSAT